MKDSLIKDYIASYLKREVPQLVEREISLKAIKGKAISVIGPRRAGKTYLLWQEIARLKRNETLYLDFEDIALTNLNAEDTLKIVKEIFTEVAGNPPVYIFLDEIQNVQNWQTLVRSLLDREYFVYLTGSSSKLLSKEIATQLRGRAITYLLLPFSFREMLKAKKISFDYSLESAGKIKQLLNEYVRFGGYPEVILNPEQRDKIISEYRETMLLKDFVEREKIKNVELGRLIFNLITQYFASEISYSSILKQLENELSFGKNTLYDYINKLQDTLAFFFLERFSTKPKLRASWPKKVYLADTGLAFRLPLDFGRLMENVVFLDLKRMQNYKPLEEIFYYRDNQGREVDFVIKEEQTFKELIQVTFASAKDEIKSNEINSLLKASEALRCNNLTVVTWDYEDKWQIDSKEINFTPLYKWLIYRNSTQ